MFCSGSNHVPSGIPAAPADFSQEEHKGGCWVGLLRNSTSLSSEARAVGELLGFSPQKTSLVFQWPAYYVGHRLLERKNNFKSRRNLAGFLHWTAPSGKAGEAALGEVAGSVAFPLSSTLARAVGDVWYPESKQISVPLNGGTVH